MSAGNSDTGIKPALGIPSLQQDLQMSEERAQRVRDLRDSMGDRQVEKPKSVYKPLPEKGRYLDIKV